MAKFDSPRYDEDQSEKREREAEGTESTDGKYPDHAVEDVDFGGSPAVPYPVRMAQLEKAREQAEEVDASDRIAENTSVGDANGFAASRDGYRAFDSGVNPPETAPAPHLDGTPSVASDVNRTPVGEDRTETDAGVNYADNGSTDSEDRTAAVAAEAGGTADVETSETAAKEASPGPQKKDEDGGKNE